MDTAAAKDRMIKFLRRLFRQQADPAPVRERRRMLPEEIEEERLLSLQMHYGDEPLYYVDPPEWP